MENIKDDRGYNQVWSDTLSTRIRAERRSGFMISKMDVDPTRSILEIGCGTGRNSFMIAKSTGMKVLGTDICAPFIEEAKKNYQLENLSYGLLNFNKVDEFQGEKFDYIIGNGILHHLYYHLDEAFTNMFNLLKANGKIIFLEPNIYNPYVAFIFNFARKRAHLEPDEMAFSKRFITNKLFAAGFKKVDVEYKDFLLPGVPEALIQPLIKTGNVLEKIPIAKMMSQSIYISASK